MNIRIQNNTLRFKISESELNDLLAGRRLREGVSLVGGGLMVEIHPFGKGDKMDTFLEKDGDITRLSLSVPSAILSQLSDMGRNRDGIKQETNGIFLNLQIDLRTDTRKAPVG